MVSNDVLLQFPQYREGELFSSEYLLAHLGVYSSATKAIGLFVGRVCDRMGYMNIIAVFFFISISIEKLIIEVYLLNPSSYFIADRRRILGFAFYRLQMLLQRGFTVFKLL